MFNVSYGAVTTLTELYWMIGERLWALHPELARLDPVYTAPREGDIRHSQADLSKIKSLLGYEPTHSVAAGLDVLIPSFAPAQPQP